MRWSWIGHNDRVAVVGTTGSGKSTLLRAALVPTRLYVALYDPKGEWTGQEWLTVREAAKLPKNPHPRVRYFPYPEELSDKEALDTFFRWVYLRQNTTLVVDEAYLATLGGRWLPPFYQACLAQGRSLGIGVISATQRPYYIPQTILTEAEHWFIFKLRAPQDVHAVAQWTGLEPRRIKALEKHEWYYVGDHGLSGPHILTLDHVI